MRSIKSHSVKEKRLLNTFHENGIKVRHDYKIGKYSYDFLIEDSLLIEFRGCFWHLHDHVKMPEGGILGKEFWKKKLLRNKERDQVKERLAILNGFPLLIVWECGEVEIVLSEEIKDSIRQK